LPGSQRCSYGKRLYNTSSIYFLWYPEAQLAFWNQISHVWLLQKQAISGYICGHFARKIIISVSFYARAGTRTRTCRIPRGHSSFPSLSGTAHTCGNRSAPRAAHPSGKVFLPGRPPRTFGSRHTAHPWPGQWAAAAHQHGAAHAQPRQVRRKLMGEDSADPLVVDTLGPEESAAQRSPSAARSCPGARRSCPVFR